MPAADLCFLASSKSGLGHLRRLATIARRVPDVAPGRRVHLISYALPEGLAEADLSAFASVLVRDRDRMAKGVSRTGAQVVVLDTITVPQIKALGLPLALVLREAPYAALQRFRLPGNRPWDLVVVANPEAHWMPANAVLAARSVAPVGWIYRPTGPRQEAPAALPRVPVATGDGGTAETAHVLYAQIDALLALARYRSTRPFTVDRRSTLVRKRSVGLPKRTASSRLVADTAWHRSSVAQQGGVPTHPVLVRPRPTLGIWPLGRRRNSPAGSPNGS